MPEVPTVMFRQIARDRGRQAAAELDADAQALAEIAARFGHYRIDVASWTVTWSAGIADIFGRARPPSGVLDLDDHLGCYHPDDAAASRDAIAAARMGDYLDRPYRRQGRVMRPDGSVRHVMAQGVGRSDGCGRLATAYGVLVDVTEAVDADRAARDGADVLRATLEAMDQGIIMVGGDGRLRVHNARAREMLGLPEYLTTPGTPFADVLAHQQASGEFDGLSDAERWFLPVCSDARTASAYRRRRPNGTMVDVQTSPLADGGFVRTFTDVTERQAKDEALLESEKRYRLLADNTTDVVIWSHLDSTRRYVSPAAKALFGYEPEELVGTRPLDFVHTDDADDLAAVLDGLTQGRTEKVTATQRFRRRDGSYVWLENSFSLIRDGAGGAATGYVVALRDVSDRKAVEDALRHSEERLSLALESGGDGVWDYDIARDHVTVAGRWWSILGYAEHEIAPTLAGWHRYTHSDDADRVLATLREHLAPGMPPVELEYRVKTRSGGYVWTLVRGKVVARDRDGAALRVIGTHMDITRRKEAEHTVARLARHDVLTGLPNRALFGERLTQEIGAAERHGGAFAVLACDLDRFKAVNDALGHGAGDALLREVARRLKAATRAQDTVARLGGDEFAVVLSRIAGCDDAFAAAQRVIDSVGQPITISGRRVEVGVSVGIAFGLDDGRSAGDLCRRADLALYAAKEGGRNAYRSYQPSMDAALSERATLEHDLHAAVTQGGFLLCYQPTFEIGTGTLVALEALLRWQHPTRGPISPSEFIPVAEQSGLMLRLGEWTLREACRTAAGWPGATAVAVNVSPAQFARPGLEQHVVSALASSGLAASRLVLEVTEGVLAHDADAAFTVLARLRALGVRLALDNFGAGPSSLNHLRRFSFDAIKLHRSLVGDLGSQATAALVRAIVEVQRGADAKVVAEGVETRDELMLVRGLGCTCAQGFLFSKPLSAEKAGQLVAVGQRAAAA